MHLAIFAASISLVPVTAGDAFLESESTFVSEEAKGAIEADPDSKLYCLTLPKKRRGISDVCLTSPEWKKVIARAERNAANAEQLWFVYQSQNRTR